MALNIKNETVVRLARDLARQRGSTITHAVEEALRAALLRERGRRIAPDVRAAIRDISDRCAALEDLDTRTPEAIVGYGPDGGLG